MKLKQAKNVFTQTYRETFQEAYGYTLAKTGDIEETPNILIRSYTALFDQLLQTKQMDTKSNRISLFKIIRHQINEYYKNDDAMADNNTGRKIKKYAQLLEEELNTELAMPANKAQLQAKLDEIWPMVSSKPIQMRRAFLLFYLFDFDIERIANELNTTEENIGNYIYLLTKEIRVNIQNDQTSR